VPKSNLTPATDLKALVAELKQDPILAGQISYVADFPPVEPVLSEWPHTMVGGVRERLQLLGIERPYRHQAEAAEAFLRGEDVMVATGTNSGKTLCFNVPTLHALLSEPAARALYIYPTKALAQDQLGKLGAMMPDAIRAAAYDGDTPASNRSAIRKSSHIVLSNPDMLHVGILPTHELWGPFLKSLRVIVIDEMHVYRGVFGSHVANVIRRLLRLCAWRRSRPQIIGCSATIGNPKALFQALTGREPALVDEDSSGHARRTFVFWNPPIIDNDKRASGNIVSSEVLATLVEHKQRTLCFNRARVSTELVLRYTRARLQTGGQVSPSVVESYRGGYTARERRQIESALFKGKLQGLAATNALELGVDIGGLDAVVMNGYPGSISSFWQQAGRAGRGDRNGLAVFVAHEDPLEQFLIREPHLVLDAANESVSLRPDNEHVLEAQLRCAGYERPLAPSELEAFGSSALELAEAMDRAGTLAFRNGLFFFPSHEAPSPSVNIRSGGGEAVSIMLQGEVLGTMDRWRAMQQAHEGAVYLHRGASYVVQRLDLNARTAEVEAAEVPYFTRAFVQSTIESDVPFDQRDCGDAFITLGRVTVTDSIDGYRLVSLDGDRILGVHPLEFPPSTFDTVAVRFDLPPAEEYEAGAIATHGLEHALLALAPLIAGCDRSDLGSSWYGVFPETLGPALFVFDRIPGGMGLAEQLYRSVEPWIKGARQLIAGCPCQDGCPSCLLSTACGANNEFLNKASTLNLLRRLG